MKIKQLTVFVENKVGYIAGICGILAENDIDMKAFSVADTKDFGILRLIVNDPEKALAVLSARGMLGKITEVIGVKIPNRPGELSKALSALSAAGINVEYLYAFLAGTPDSAYVVIKATDDTAARKVLKNAGFNGVEEF
ncbi:MAG: hypothetical protein IJU83_02000 [Clostridia bacterium]|nr:hypothetical protein [Clostridia bacterium]